MGTAVGTHVFIEYGWRPAAALSVAWSVFTLVVMLARGPHCRRNTWFGYEGGCELRKDRMGGLVETRAVDLEDQSVPTVIVVGHDDETEEKAQTKEAHDDRRTETETHGTDVDITSTASAVPDPTPVPNDRQHAPSSASPLDQL